MYYLNKCPYAALSEMRYKNAKPEKATSLIMHNCMQKYDCYIHSVKKTDNKNYHPLLVVLTMKKFALRGYFS